MEPSKDLRITYSPWDSETAEDSYQIHIQFKDYGESGLFYKITSVFYCHGWDILEAVLRSDHSELQDHFVVRHKERIKFDEEVWFVIKHDIQELFQNKHTVIEYLGKKGIQHPAVMRSPQSDADKEPVVEIATVPPNSLLLSIQTQDQVGLLFQMAELFLLLGINILQAHINTDNNRVMDQFVIQALQTDIYSNSELQEKLAAQLRELL